MMIAARAKMTHADVGAAERRQWLDVWSHERGIIVQSNECLYVYSRAAETDCQNAADEMELTLTLATAKCSHCGAVNVFPGLTKMIAFTCLECEQSC